MKPVQIALLLALLLPLAGGLHAQQNKSSSFKSGFSSQKSSSARSGSGFGSFGSRTAPPPRAPQPAQAGRSGGFGSFGGAAAPAPRQSDSALSQRLNKSASETNAMNTLEARRRAEQDAMNAAARPVPSGPLPHNDTLAGRSGAGMSAPIVIQQNSGGIGSMITGFLLGKASSPARAGYNGYPGQPGVAATAPAKQGSSFFMSMLRTFAWLLILSIVAWSAYFAWKFLRRGSAPSQSNYSFER